MTSKVSVNIRLESIHQGEVTIQEMRGDMYDLGDHLYLRYQEPVYEFGEISTTIRVDPHSIKIIRRGDTYAEHLFVSDTTSIGYYETVQGKIKFDIHTHRIGTNTHANSKDFNWSYDLYIDQAHIGLYLLKLSIREELLL